MNAIILAMCLPKDLIHPFAITFLPLIIKSHKDTLTQYHGPYYNKVLTSTSLFISSLARKYHKRSLNSRS